LNLQLLFHLNSSRLELEASINYDKGDAVTLLQCIRFIQSFKTAKKLSFFNCNTGKTDILLLPILPDFKVHPLLLDFVSSLAILQDYSGIVFRIPESLTNEQFSRELHTAKTAAKIVKTKTLHIPQMKFTLVKNMAAQMIEDYRQHKIINDLVMRIPYRCTVLGQQVIINESTLNLSHVRPVGDLLQLLETTRTQQKDYVEIEMVKL